jgi:hypothetical protein
MAPGDHVFFRLTIGNESFLSDKTIADVDKIGVCLIYILMCVSCRSLFQYNVTFNPYFSFILFYTLLYH